MERETLNILILSDFAFPYGTGAASRVYGYARGLLGAGARVKVLCVEPSWNTSSTLNTAPSVVYRGIEFDYTGGYWSKPRSRLGRGIVRLLKWPRFALAVNSWAVEVGGVDAMIVYSRKLPWIAAARLLCSTTGAVLLHEDCELKFRFSADTMRTRLKRFAYERLSFAAYDGCLAISIYLEEYCSRHLRHGIEALLVPILVNVADFGPNGVEVEVGNRVTFCGGLDQPEALNVLKTFAQAVDGPHDDMSDLRLQLVGTAVRKESLERLRSVAGGLGITERVDFVGQVAREELVELLNSSRVLVLPRPAGAFSKAGLATKLGEYLASGRPTVVTANGDVGLYLHDGVDAYLTPPDDLDAFARRLRYVLEHPQEADEVGLRGRQAAQTHFDPVVHGRRIIDYVRELQAVKAARRARRAGRGRSTRAATDVGASTKDRT